METLINKTIQLSNASVSLTEEGYYFINVNENTEVDLDLLKQIIASMSQLQNKKKLPVLIIMQSFSMPTEEARTYLAKENSSPNAAAEAYVIHSMAQKIIGNFYLKVNKPARPTKLFTGKTEALEWLKEFENS